MTPQVKPLGVKTLFQKERERERNREREREREREKEKKSVRERESVRVSDDAASQTDRRKKPIS